jgi:hypothetical protein
LSSHADQSGPDRLSEQAPLDSGRAEG